MIEESVEMGESSSIMSLALTKEFAQSEVHLELRRRLSRVSSPLLPFNYHSDHCHHRILLLSWDQQKPQCMQYPLLCETSTVLSSSHSWKCCRFSCCDLSFRLSRSRCQLNQSPLPIMPMTLLLISGCVTVVSCWSHFYRFDNFSSQASRVSCFVLPFNTVLTCSTTTECPSMPCFPYVNFPTFYETFSD